MTMLSSAFPAGFDESRLELKPVAVTRWTARLADLHVEETFRESRFHDDRRCVLVLFGFVVIAGALIVGGRFVALLAGFGDWTRLLPPLVPVVFAACGLCVLLRMKTAQALQLGMLGIGTIVVLVRFATMTFQPAMADNWLPLMVTSVFIIYIYFPLRLLASMAFATFYSIASVTWWLSLYGRALGTEQIYFGILWVMLANGLGFAAANALQRGQRIQYAQRLVMQQLLATDALTGIANRRRFDDELKREWRRCGRSRMPLSLLMIDVDHFKAYNDRWGHQQGDACLRLVAQLLLGTVKRPGDLIARYGGEEFVCLLPGVGVAGARAAAARLAASVERANVAHPSSPTAARLTLSIGAATVDEFDAEPMALVALADKLLYEAKNAGRDRVAAGGLHKTPAIMRAA
jgi:diguanylate cyclase (GGDEF)-like protein